MSRYRAGVTGFAQRPLLESTSDQDRPWARTTAAGTTLRSGLGHGMDERRERVHLTADRPAPVARRDLAGAVHHRGHALLHRVDPSQGLTATDFEALVAEQDHVNSRID
jgi:hypothetical protein